MSRDPNRRLFVEGPSDGSVINRLVEARLGIDIATQRWVHAPPEEGGFEMARASFVAALTAETPSRLGLVVDRDNQHNAPDRWNSVRGILVAHGFEPPAEPGGGGIRLTRDLRRVGVWLMPDNVSPGDLESFLETLLPNPRPPSWDWAVEATLTAKQQKGAAFRDPADQAKARLHTWLAWNDPPGRPYGIAIKTQSLGVNSPTASAFIDWFQWLFVDTVMPASSST